MTPEDSDKVRVGDISLSKRQVLAYVLPLFLPTGALFLGLTFPENGVFRFIFSDMRSLVSLPALYFLGKWISSLLLRDIEGEQTQDPEK